MTKTETIQLLIEELDFEISLLDPTSKTDKIQISNLKAQKTKYAKFLATIAEA